MPRQVDAHARRERIAEIAASLLATGGRTAVSVRSIARNAGVSKAVVTHYFENMDELLEATYENRRAKTRARVQSVVAHDPTDLVALAEAILPLDDERRMDWAVYIGFFGEAATAPSMAARQREAVRGMRDRFFEALAILHERERLPADIDLDTTADRLIALVEGIANVAYFDPDAWTPERQLSAFRSGLEIRDPAPITNTAKRRRAPSRAG
jgi:TetR/AcrR family transcriptional regulator, transcriptional repressor of bet genes